MQLQDKGISANLDTILKGIVERDLRDEHRAISPLKPDLAAMVIDTTKLGIDEVLQLVLMRVKETQI